MHTCLIPSFLFLKLPKKLVRKNIIKPHVPEHRQSYENMLNWVDSNARELIKELTPLIISLGGVTHKPTGTDYIFYRGKPSSKSSFAVFLL